MYPENVKEKNMIVNLSIQKSGKFVSSFFIVLLSDLFC